VTADLFGCSDLDRTWAALARDSREALRLLGYPINPVCLPDETKPCGAGFALHVASHLAYMMAVIDHHIAHLGDEFLPVIEEIRANAAAEIGCDQLHGPGGG